MSKQDFCRTLTHAALALCLLALSPAGSRSQNKQAPQEKEAQSAGAGGPAVSNLSQGPDGPFPMSQVDKKAVIKKKPEPGVTAAARDHLTVGVVRLRAILSSSGGVTNIKVIQGLPDGLTEKAVAAAKKIKFIPAQKNGRPVSQYILLDYHFNLYP